MCSLHWNIWWTGPSYNEFETFKQTTGDQLIRKDEEIRDIKTDLINKDKYIQKIQRGNNSLIVKNIKKNFIETGNIQERRRYTLLPGTGVGGNNSLSFKNFPY